MKSQFFALLGLLLIQFTIFGQTNRNSKNTFSNITPLKNNTYEIREFTRDSILIYKGTLSTVDPEVRHGRFYFYDIAGNIITYGVYKQDIPYGTWIYFNDSHDTIKTINYTAVWDYLEKDAFDYSIDSTVIKKLKKKDKLGMNPDGTFFSVDKMPTFNGKDPFIEFNKYLTENLVYPIYASRKKIYGEIKVEFILDSLGKIRNPIVLNPRTSDLNIEAIRVISESPAWEAGYQNGYPVNVKLSWPVRFNPFTAYSINPIPFPVGEYDESESSVGDDVYYIVEDMPTFNGGDPATEFVRFIFQNLRYPDDASNNCISGRVVVQFAIDTNGRLVDAIVVVPVDPSLDAEALRVVNASPLWKPGFQRGEPVKVVFTFPINFVIHGDMELPK